MIIDAHVHVKGGDEYRREFPPDLILQTMDEAGIDKSVIFAICLPSRQSNDLTLRCFEACPDRFIPFAHVLPQEGKQAIIELERATGEMGCRGLKLHVGEMPQFEEPEIIAALTDVCIAAREIDLAVLIDFGNRFPICEALVDAVPGLKLIVAHLGSPQNETIVNQFIGLAYDNPNMYLDASYSTCCWKIPEAISRLGADRIIFGSDGPLIHPAIELMKIKVCNLSDEDFEKVTWRNIEGLLA